MLYLQFMSQYLTINVSCQGNLEAACSVFDAALQSEKTKEDSRALTILYIQYARFLDQVSKAVNILQAHCCTFFIVIYYFSELSELNFSHTHQVVV